MDKFKHRYLIKYILQKIIKNQTILISYDKLIGSILRYLYA